MISPKPYSIYLKGTLSLNKVYDGMRLYVGSVGGVWGGGPGAR